MAWPRALSEILPRSRRHHTWQCVYLVLRAKRRQNRRNVSNLYIFVWIMFKHLEQYSNVLEIWSSLILLNVCGNGDNQFVNTELVEEMERIAVSLWFTHSFFIHPLIPPTFKKWVGASSLVLQSFHFSTAKLRKLACKFRIFVLQRLIFSPAIVHQTRPTSQVGRHTVEKWVSALLNGTYCQGFDPPTSWSCITRETHYEMECRSDFESYLLTHF